MSSFTWRGLTVRRLGENSIGVQAEGLQATPEWTFPAPVVHAHAMDQNVIVVLLEDGSLWQCGGCKQCKLVPAAAAENRSGP